MNLFFRLIWMYVSTLFKGDINLLEELVTQRRVLPTDLDINLHMNNGRYMTLTDIERMELLLRSGAWKKLRKKGWLPVLGGCMVTFRKPLNPFQKYSVHTKIVCWDDKWLYIQHIFKRGEDIAAIDIVRGTFVGKQGRVPIEDVIEILGITQESPPCPNFIADWQQADADLFANALK